MEARPEACRGSARIFGENVIMFRNFEELQRAGKERFEATTEATANFFKGLQQIAVETTGYSSNSVKSSVGLIGEMFGAKTIEDAIHIQSAYAKSAHESFLAQSAKIGELYANLAKEAFKPVEFAAARSVTKSRQTSSAA